MAMSRTKDINKLFDFLKLVSRIEKKPGFSSLLGLSHSRLSLLSPDQITFENKDLTLQLPLDTHLHLPHQKIVSLSTYLSIIDDTTTWALVLSDPARSRAGVSVSLQLECGPAASKCRPGDLVNVISRTSKIGRKIGFAEAEVRDAKSNELICFGTHVKYLPMGYLADFALSSYGWPLLMMYTDYVSSAEEDEKEDFLFEDGFGSFQMEENGNRGTFVASRCHSSLGGPLHGGCQAVLMELAATRVAERELGASLVSLEYISVDYLSPPNSKDVSLEVEPITQCNAGMTVRVKLMTKGRCKSVGILRFVTKQP